MATPTHDAAQDLLRLQLQHAAGHASFWRQMLAQIERDRRRLRYVLPAGAPLALVVALGTRSLSWGGVAAAATVAVFFLGAYFTQVRTAEYRYNLEEALADLARAQKALAGLQSRETATEPAALQDDDGHPL